MPRILIAVDGSKNAERAVQHVIDLTTRRGPIEVHLLNVQPPIESGEVRRFVSKATIDAYYRDEGTAALAGAEALLKQAGCPYVAHIEAGHFAETIADHARRHGCDRIVMGTRGMSTLGNWLLGSVATKVIHLVDVPVTLIK